MLNLQSLGRDFLMAKETMTFDDWFKSLQNEDLNHPSSLNIIAEQITQKLPKLKLASEVMPVVQFALDVDLKLGVSRETQSLDSRTSR
jgi:hypothetical protein